VGRSNRILSERKDRDCPRIKEIQKFSLTTEIVSCQLLVVSCQRTRTLAETQGFLKALIEKGGDRILGFTAFGIEAGEVMAVAQVAMAAGLPYTALRDTVLTHPTMAEGLGELLSSVPRG
jgi:pyruvate/2-oxoglutarate dehydrogenase complex dihydrolipoamide dehydrogenase (E3) component